MSDRPTFIVLVRDEPTGAERVVECDAANMTALRFKLPRSRGEYIVSATLKPTA